ncbi:hypothetical protein RMT89_39315 [Streptomyces sp. P17]|nr:hypothetical protein [Streptomyces sp. P17]
MPVEEKGYGPKWYSAHSMTSGSSSTLSPASRGSTAVYTGTSPAVDRRISYAPIATVATWLAIGSALRQRKAVRPARP